MTRELFYIFIYFFKFKLLALGNMILLKGKGFIRFLVFCIATILLMWMIMAGFVLRHKSALLNQISIQINTQIKGRLQIGNLELSFLKGFPGITFLLHDLTLKESECAVTNKPLLTAKNLFVKVNVWSLLQKQVKIERIWICDAEINIHADEKGNPHTDILSGNSGKKMDTKGFEINIEMLHFVYENSVRRKYFNINLIDGEGRFKKNKNGWKASLSFVSTVSSLCFNTDKGSYAKGKTIKGNWQISYDEGLKKLTVFDNSLLIDADKIQGVATFFLAEKPVKYILKLRDNAILFKNATAIFPQQISQKLSFVNLKNTIQIEALLNGQIRLKDTPTVFINWQTSKNILSLPLGDIFDCSLVGNFTNKGNIGQGCNQSKPSVQLYRVHGTWQRIPFDADTLLVSNLSQPILDGNFRSTFNLPQVNNVLGSKSFLFQSGYATAHIRYHGGIRKTDTTKAFVYGFINTNDATFSYVPRLMHFSKCALEVRFEGRDVFIPKLEITGGTSTILMSGSAKDFLSLYYTDPQKMMILWDLRSTHLNLADFAPLFSKRKESSYVDSSKLKTLSDKRIAKIAIAMDRIMEESSVHVNILIDSLNYRHFSAGRIAAEMTLHDQIIEIQKVQLHHADGLLLANATIRQEEGPNPFRLKAQIKDVDVKKFFAAFDNFHQKTLSAENINGKFFAKADITGSLYDNGILMPYSLGGTVLFNLKNGCLNNFPPLMKMGKIIFPNRDFKNIRIARMQNTLQIAGNKIIIPPMFLESSVFNAQIKGVYGFKSGTNIKIDVPLRNPQKNANVFSDSLREKLSMKGIVLHLQAIEGKNGSKIRLRNARK
ncbi:MAG: hypothetical protein JST88_00845 [Bacteroidetes bacterium]|nr:hypothetical protein [Bacteroidota bacterium]